MKIVGMIVVLFLIVFTIEKTLNESFEGLLVKAKKYAHINVSQNDGLHKLILKVVQKLVSVYPSPELYNKPDHIDGVGAQSNLSNELGPNSTIVTSTKELKQAITNVKPGQTILLSPGIYDVTSRYLLLKNSGTFARPITLRANTLGDAVLRSNSVEGLLIQGKNWRIENLIFKGVKGKDGSIEHAIHIVGDADNIQIKNNKFINFNSHIKSNGKPNAQGKIEYPDNLLILNNDIYNEWKRNTHSPASPIDLVGGNYVIVKNNFIADFGKYGKKGFGTTYGAYMKGGGIGGIFENNVVMCEWRVPHTSPMDVRIGLSFGNGGTGGQFCADKKCEYEHTDGVMRNNTILNCVNDVGIYLNKSYNTLIENNAIRSSLGVDVRFEQSSAEIRGNVIEGRVKARDGATITVDDNIIE
ncbi:right-handed parallel beta-helix repeat-containing protein [Thalassotalea atypica]|uniref:right-handed parallel beta-helix repeat-containing protein n=1 Tax=Thalassotalea atypica TaxID=2054316 RepID=UPI0025737817|nr:chondroitinase-B domain-containing protein [Thalassotalea atypica]